MSFSQGKGAVAFTDTGLRISRQQARLDGTARWTSHVFFPDTPVGPNLLNGARLRGFAVAPTTGGVSWPTDEGISRATLPGRRPGRQWPRRSRPAEPAQLLLTHSVRHTARGTIRP